MNQKTRWRLRLFLFLLVVGGVYLRLHIFERQFTFNPNATLSRSPHDIDLPFDNVMMTTSDGVTIHGWFVPEPASEDPAPTNSPSPTLLFLHGGDGNISDRLEKIRFFHDLGLNVFIIDYRGYGRSAGTPSEEGLINDARAAHSYLVYQRDVNPEQLYIYGEDLGAAVGIALAAKEPSAGLITEGATASVIEKIGQEWPLIPWPYLSRDRFDSLSRIGDVHVPVLLIHSSDDDVVSFNDSRRLFALAHDPRQLLEVHGSHKDVLVNSFDAYYDAVSRFVGGQPRPEPGQPENGEDAISTSTPGDAPASNQPTP
jgi:uncharacterized protein